MMMIIPFLFNPNNQMHLTFYIQSLINILVQQQRWFMASIYKLQLIWLLCASVLVITILTSLCPAPALLPTAPPAPAPAPGRARGSLPPRRRHRPRTRGDRSQHRRRQSFPTHFRWWRRRHLLTMYIRASN